MGPEANYLAPGQVRYKPNCKTGYVFKLIREKKVPLPSPPLLPFCSFPPFSPVGDTIGGRKGFQFLIFLANFLIFFVWPVMGTRKGVFWARPWAGRMAHPQLKKMGRPHKTSEPEHITDTEAEFVVTYLKHVFAEKVVFEVRQTTVAEGEIHRAKSIPPSLVSYACVCVEGIAETPAFFFARVEEEIRHFYF